MFNPDLCWLYSDPLTIIFILQHQPFDLTQTHAYTHTYTHRSPSVAAENILLTYFVSWRLKALRDFIHRIWLKSGLRVSFLSHLSWPQCWPVFVSQHLHVHQSATCIYTKSNFHSSYSYFNVEVIIWIIYVFFESLFVERLKRFLVVFFFFAIIRVRFVHEPVNTVFVCAGVSLPSSNIWHLPAMRLLPSGLLFPVVWPRNRPVPVQAWCDRSTVQCVWQPIRWGHKFRLWRWGQNKKRFIRNENCLFVKHKKLVLEDH